MTWISDRFSRQVEALGRKGDILVGISTSGNSPNVLAALEAARSAGMRTLGLTGRGGGKMAPLCHMLAGCAQFTYATDPGNSYYGRASAMPAYRPLSFENVAALTPYLHADTVKED